MRKATLLIPLFIITLLTSTSGIYAITNDSLEVTAKDYKCPILKCTDTKRHSHSVCSYDSCLKTSLHLHDGIYYIGHSKNDGHKYHSTCTQSDCTKLNLHSHCNQADCTNERLHSHCKITGCTNLDKHSHSSNHNYDGHNGNHNNGNHYNSSNKNTTDTTNNNEGAKNTHHNESNGHHQENHGGKHQ